MVVFVVKRYTVRETEKWRYAVPKAKIGRYAVRKGGGGVTLHYSDEFLLTLVFTICFLYSLQILGSTDQKRTIVKTRVRRKACLLVILAHNYLFFLM